MNIIELIKNGESKTLELKEKLPASQKLAATAVAFSNTAGGKIIIGVNDKREIVGVSDDEIFDIQEKVSSVIYDLCYPNILPEIYVQNVDGKLLLVVEIYKGSLLPYYLKNKGKLNGTYIRIGTTNRLADENIIQELERQRMGKTFDEEENYSVTPEKIDLTPIYKEFEKIDKSVSISQLRNLKLFKNIYGKDIPTNALLIITGNLENTGIKCARFKGTTSDIFLDKKEFSADAFSNLNNAILFLKNHLNLEANIEGLKRVEQYEIPLVVLREALLNAIIHRDYTRNSDIKVAVYDDMVEIVSPGGLPNGLTVTDVFEGRSELRNKIIAKVFKELGYVETWGTGIKRIEKMCKNNNIKFEFKENSNFVSVIFYRDKIVNKVQESSGKVAEKYRKSGEKVANKQRKSGEKIILTKQEAKIIDYINNKNKITTGEVKSLFNIKSARARRILLRMSKKGILKKIGKTKGSFYILNEDNGNKFI